MARDDDNDLRRYRGNLQAEVDGSTLYSELARLEQDEGRKSVLEELASTEQRHARLWADKLQEAGAKPAVPGPSFRARLIRWLARRFGPRAVMPIMAANEGADGTAYAGQADAKSLAREERSHGHILSDTTSPEGRAGIARREKWHRGSGGGSLRATLFGVNDGLVSNLSLVMGVSGANPGGRFVLLTGIAGLLAGAFSMAAGEYVSMKSQRELLERQIQLEREELAATPEEEQQELALIYRSKGIPREEAERLAARLIADHEVALDTLAKEELGLDPEDLGSPWGAAGGSFVAFAIGALMPVLPFLFLQGTFAIAGSAVLSSVSLCVVGATFSLFTGRSPVFSALRMLLIGLAAAGVTYLVGSLIGVSVSG